MRSSRHTQSTAPAGDSVRKSRSGWILSAYKFLARPDNMARTTVVLYAPAWLSGFVRLQPLWTAFALLRGRSGFDAVVVTGDGSGFAFAALQRLIPGRRAETIFVECNWYREARSSRRALRHWQLRFCLKAVDRCVVWAEGEIQAYARSSASMQASLCLYPSTCRSIPAVIRLRFRKGTTFLCRAGLTGIFEGSSRR